jgi:hypothetical protein
MRHTTPLRWRHTHPLLEGALKGGFGVIPNHFRHGGRWDYNRLPAAGHSALPEERGAIEQSVLVHQPYLQ